MNVLINSKNAAPANRGIPRVIAIPSVQTKSTQKSVSKSSNIYFDGDTSSPGSEATQQDLDDMKRMVRELRNQLRNQPASAVYQKTFGLVRAERDTSREFASQVSISSVTTADEKSSEATQQDLEDMKQMVRDLRNQPALYRELFGLVDDSESDVGSKFARQVSNSSV
jgi:uncharacterized membrane-anchored protein YjiN (DUF445 family)